MSFGAEFLGGVPRATHTAFLLGYEDLAGVSCLLSFPLMHDTVRDTGKSIMSLGNTRTMFNVSNCCTVLALCNSFLPHPISSPFILYRDFRGKVVFLVFCAILFPCGALSPLPTKRPRGSMQTSKYSLMYELSLVSLQVLQL